MVRKKETEIGRPISFFLDIVALIGVKTLEQHCFSLFPCCEIVLADQKGPEAISPISLNFGAEMLSPIKRPNRVPFIKISKSDYHFRFQHDETIPNHPLKFNFEPKR